MKLQKYWTIATRDNAKLTRKLILKRSPYHPPSVPLTGAWQTYHRRRSQLAWSQPSLLPLVPQNLAVLVGKHVAGFQCLITMSPQSHLLSPLRALWIGPRISILYAILTTPMKTVLPLDLAPLIIRVLLLILVAIRRDAHGVNLLNSTFKDMAAAVTNSWAGEDGWGPEGWDCEFQEKSGEDQRPVDKFSDFYTLR